MARRKRTQKRFTEKKNVKKIRGKTKRKSRRRNTRKKKNMRGGMNLEIEEIEECKKPHERYVAYLNGIPITFNSGAVKSLEGLFNTECGGRRKVPFGVISKLIKNEALKAQHNISDRNYDPETLRRRDLLEDQGRLAYHKHGFQPGCHRIKPYSDLPALSQQIRENDSVQSEIRQWLLSCDD